MKKNKPTFSKMETVKKYIEKILLDKSIAFANNQKLNSNNDLQQNIIGSMSVISEIKRFIEYIEWRDE